MVSVLTLKITWCEKYSLSAYNIEADEGYVKDTIWNTVMCGVRVVMYTIKNARYSAA